MNNKKINWVPDKKINGIRVSQLLESSLLYNQFTNNGPNVKLLEKVIREKLEIDDTKAVIAVTNGSVALHSLAASIEYFNKQKINWATQSFTFPPSAQGTLSNAKIVDIDKEGGLSLDELDESINGIIVTNIFGNVVNIEKYENWALDNSKFLIFDNAATPFTFYKGKSCCNYGIGCTISFHHTKPIGFGEGGAIIVDKKYENSIRCLNNFGIDLTDKYWMSEGNNNKMSDISAIYILQYLLSEFDNINNKHKSLYNYFKNLMEKHNIKHFKLFPSFHDENNNLIACFSILFNNYDDKYRTLFLENGIFCRKYYNPLKDTKNASEIFKNILCFPCTKDMNFSDLNNIFELIR